ncbi:hypothetical protein CCZ01_06165 [Helicobacter monodelphidis]|uniref:FtsK/SpoIIIE domain-containing protein n=1 Tax=Helicobacter sp. 15-1451 TaxID=2004995 RepID=UPI000DCD7932|nr:FtsK/SpoIIIE domain-containing protein [Helicobacter sp. 15-1451]RAX57419.1 hypothetical protein CCZ01_06165 [Helicobacter sp. 15-1451]
MADFYTNKAEEYLIQRIIGRDGLGFSPDTLPKYFILRLALSLALKLPHLPLHSPEWERKRLDAQRDKEYHLEQLTGKGKSKQEDFDSLTRSIFYINHKDELNDKNIDIFSHDEKYLEILSKYIHRGLYEIHNTWKNNDCFYQWCIDNLKLDFPPQSHKNIESSTQNKDLFEQIKQYFSKFSIDVEHINTTQSYRHDICRIQILDSSKIESFKNKAKNLEDELGVESVLLQSCKENNLSKTYDIQVAKPQDKWSKITKDDFKQGIESLHTKDYKLGIFAGFGIDKNPYCFDLASAPHLFAAGATGSGKTILLQNIIISLLKNKNRIDIIIIDPKNGTDYKIFESHLEEFIIDMRQASKKLDEYIDEMEERYKLLAGHNADDINALNLPYQVIIIDELNDLVMSDKTINDKLTRLAQKSRQAGIHLILGTQRPDSKVFTGGLRSNIPTRIALKVSKASDSRIILDENGAEKLLGQGDMLIKTTKSSELKRVFGAKLEASEIQSLIVR